MEKIRLYDDIDQDKENLRSSWLWDIRWNDNVLIIRRYEDIQKDNKTIRRIIPMKYRDIPYDLFEKIKKSNSKGHAVNQYIIDNKNVEKAEVSESVKEFVK